MANVGTPKYKDLLNNKTIEKLKAAAEEINANFKMLANDISVANREDDKYEKYMPQYLNDLRSLRKMRDASSEIMGICDEICFILGARTLESRIYSNSEEE